MFSKDSFRDEDRKLLRDLAISHAEIKTKIINIESNLKQNIPDKLFCEKNNNKQKIFNIIIIIIIASIYMKIDVLKILKVMGLI